MLKKLKKGKLPIFLRNLWFDRILLQICCFGKENTYGTKIVTTFVHFRFGGTRFENTRRKWMIFHPICKCDRRTIISKIGSAELQVVSNDGIKSPLKGFLKPLLAFFDLTERMKPVKTNGSKKNNSNGNRAACLHAPTNYRTKNAVALQIFSSRRRRKEGDYACTQKNWFLQRNPLWTRKFSMGYRP